MSYQLRWLLRQQLTLEPSILCLGISSTINLFSLEKIQSRCGPKGTHYSIYWRRQGKNLGCTRTCPESGRIQPQSLYVQFVKGSWHYGELDSAKRLAPEFELITAGKGFVGILDDKSPREDHVKAANEALAIGKEKIVSGKYDVVILDEINYAVQLELLKLSDVIDVIKSKPPELDLVLTGNHASKEVIELADLVTEMKEIKHPFKSGIKAKKGIDF